ncbi:MAG: hypothetical protein ACLFU7_08305 [Armatimonadota bacterium]
MQRKMTVIVLSIAVASCGYTQDLPEPVDLSGAEALAHPAPAPQVIDGREQTSWSSGTQDLSEVAANVFIKLAEPVTVGRMEVLIPIHPEPEKYPMRIVNMDIYAQAGDGWAKIGEIRGNTEQPSIMVELTPAEVEILRLRILPRSETITGFAMISDVRLFPPDEGVEPAGLEPTPIEESETEQRWVSQLVNPRPPGPRVEFDPEIGYLGYVRTWFETMAEHGTDRYGEVHSPMFCSILDMERLIHPKAATHPNMELPTVHGQRTADRTDNGGNLQQDVMAILAAHYVTEITGDERYREIARDYLQFFLDNCTDTPTGLWPWGEHTYWDFFEETFARTNHHLLCAPLEFWELAYELNPEAVIGEADGIINHITDMDTFVFNRHADITRVLPDPRPEDLQSLDFPNSASRYLRLWAFAWSKTGDEKYLDWSNRLLDHLEWTRIDGDGGLPVLSARSTRPQPDSAWWTSTMLVGMSLLEYAPLLGDTPTADRFREFGEEMMALCAEQPLPSADRPPIFHVERGMGGPKTFWAQAYRMTGNEHFLEAARRMAMPYLALEQMPEDIPLRAQSYGVAINLMMDMYEFESDPKWLEAAEKYARWAIETLYFNGLFRGTPDLWYQDAHLGTATLVYALVRVDAAVEDAGVEVPPNVYGF